MVADLFLRLFSRKRAQPSEPAKTKDPTATSAKAQPDTKERKTRARYSVGRAAHNDIVLDEDSVSKTGLYIVEYEDGGFRLIDTGSVNGVWIEVSGAWQRLNAPVDVQADDPIRVGQMATTVRALLRRGRSAVDIFVSYAREDAEAAKRLEVDLMGEGWKLWRDDKLAVARPFDQQLEAVLNTARCVVVLWSQYSVSSQWVRAEASIALERGVLVPVFIQRVDPPVLFRQIQGVLVDAIDPEPREAQIKSLIDKLHQFIGAPSRAG